MAAELLLLLLVRSGYLGLALRGLGLDSLIGNCHTTADLLLIP